MTHGGYLTAHLPDKETDMNFFIFGAGEWFDSPILPKEGDLCIAADGGLAYMERLGIAPDIIVGDFDSGRIPNCPPCPVLRYPIEKNETDCQLAITQGLMRGCDSFFLLGCTGGRADHTVGAIACLAHLAILGKRAYLMGDGICYLVLRNGTLRIPEDLPFSPRPGTASVFAIGGDAKGVTITGMKYEADNINLFYHIPTGVSNELSDAPAAVSVREGSLLLILGI
jgi:thiamine pyrophosphokinase